MIAVAPAAVGAQDDRADRRAPSSAAERRPRRRRRRTARRCAVVEVGEAAEHVGADHEHVARRGRPRSARRPSASADRKPVQAAPTSIAPALRGAERVRDERRARSGVSSSAARSWRRARGRASLGVDAGVARAPRRPAAVARSDSRSPSARAGARARRCGGRSTARSRRRRSAIGAFGTTRSGTAMATDARAAARRWRSHGMGVAVTAAAGSEAAASRTAALASGHKSSGLRTGGLHRKGLLHKVRQHVAGAGLDEVGHAALVERADHVEPADRLGQRADQLARERPRTAWRSRTT